MKKRILAVLLSVAGILVTVCAPVGAETFNNIGYSVDYVNSKVTVSAETGIPGINASLIVLNDGWDMSLLQNTLFNGTLQDLAAAYQYQAQTTTDENGKIDFIFPLNIADKEAGGDFEVYAKIPGSSAEKLFAVNYLSQSDRAAFIGNFQTDVETIKTFLNNRANREVLGIRDELYNALDKDLLAAGMLNKFNLYVTGGTAGTTEKFAEACEYARELVILALFNQSKVSVLFDAEGNYKCEDTLDFTKYDTLNQTNIYSTYKNVLSSAGKLEIAAKVMGKNYATIDELYKDFAINTVLIGLTNPKDTGFAQVEILLSAGNRIYVGLTFGTVPEYMEPSIAAHAGFNTLADLTTFVSSLAQSSGSGSGAGDGGAGVGKKPVSTVGGTFGGGSAAMTPIVPPVETPVVVFKDIPEDHWAIEGIAYLKAKGVVDGVSNDTFDPNGLVTREQLVKMIFGITGLELTKYVESPFTDAPVGEWYTDYIISMKDEGFINGVSETEFGIGQYATRQDICAIVNRILGLGGAGAEFTDGETIADYASDAVAALSYNKIVNGYPDGSFRPNGICTRAEAATIIYRASKFAEVK